MNFLELKKDGTLNPEQVGRILNAVREAARQAANVIVYQHNHYWGDASGSGQPPGRSKTVNRIDAPWLVEWTHRLIEAGASMYVGHGDPVLHGSKSTEAARSSSIWRQLNPARCYTDQRHPASWRIEKPGCHRRGGVHAGPSMGESSMH